MKIQSTSETYHSKALTSKTWKRSRKTSKT